MNSEQRLLEAIVSGDVYAALLELNDAGIDRQYNNRTPVLWAIQEDQTSLVAALLAEGASFNLPDTEGFTPLYQAAAQGNLDIIKLLFDAGADANQDTPHGSPLLLAIAYEHVEAAALLLSYGADPDKADKEGATPRSTAISYGNERLIALLK